MKKIFNKNKSKLTIGIIVSLFILSIMVWMVIGYSELIKDSSIGKITFYSVIVIFFIWKLGDMFSEEFRDVFIERKKIKNGK